jgi:hypothetical protein
LAESQCQWQQSENGGECGHSDRPHPIDPAQPPSSWSCFMNGMLVRVLCLPV